MENVTVKTLPELFEDHVEYSREIISRIAPMAINIELLNGEVSGLSQKRETLKEENKKLEARNAALKAEIDHIVKNAEFKANEILERAKKKEVELIQKYDQKEKELNLKYQKNYQAITGRAA